MERSRLHRSERRPEYSSARGVAARLFFRNFLKHPRMLGSVIPSSRFLIESLLRAIDWERARVIVEYGPGIGSFTLRMLERMRTDAQLIVIETNEDFVRYLRTQCADARLDVVHASAADVEHVLATRGLLRADYVVSGIPFSTMPASLRERVLRATRRVLEPDGAFLVYQFSSRVLADLQRIFPRVLRGFEPLNILPAQIFRCLGEAA